MAAAAANNPETEAETERREGETETKNDDELIVKRKSCGSLIWRWFGFDVTDVEQKNARCRLCLKKVAAKGSSTTNLFHHLTLMRT